MKRLLIYVLILGIACWAGLTLKSNTGYVLISYQHWVLETSLWMAIIITLVFFYLMFLFFRFSNFLIITHGNFRRWQRQQKLIKSHTLTGAGLLAIVEADWGNAEQLLIKGLDSSTIPVVNFIRAAEAANEQGKIDKRNEYLAKARECAEKDELIAVDLTEAKILLQNREYDRASKLLADLYKTKPKHAYILKLLVECQSAQHHWNEVHYLMSDILKTKIINPTQLKELQFQTYQPLLSQARDTDELKSLWKNMPKQLHQDELLQSIYEQKKASFKQDRS